MPPPSLSTSDLSTYKLVATEVENPQIIVSWPAQEDAFIATAEGGPEVEKRLATGPASYVPGATAFFKRALESKLINALKASVGPTLSGQKPVVAHIKLIAFDIPSVGRRILVGGSAVIKMEIDLVDPATGQVVVAYPGEFESVSLTGGLLAPVTASIKQEQDVADELVARAMRDYKSWLVERPGGTRLTF